MRCTFFILIQMHFRYLTFLYFLLLCQALSAQHSAPKAEYILRALQNTLRNAEGKRMELQEAKSYFMEVALQEEFYKGQAPILRKWQGEIRYQVQGKASDVLLQELQHIVEELSLLTGLAIKPVSSAQKANLIIFFGKGKDYAAIEPAATAYIAAN